MKWRNCYIEAKLRICYGTLLALSMFLHWPYESVRFVHTFTHMGSENLKSGWVEGVILIEFYDPNIFVPQFPHLERWNSIPFLGTL